MSDKKKTEDEEILYNCFCEPITRESVRYRRDEFGFIDANGISHTNWGPETEDCDEYGFDKHFRPIEGSDEYLIKDFILPKGFIVCRYGNPFGMFTSVKGSDYNRLGLPYEIRTIEYHEYVVTSETEVDCIVMKGKVAPKFDSEGGAIQFRHQQIIKLECDDGKLREVFAWLH